MIKQGKDSVHLTNDEKLAEVHKACFYSLNVQFFNECASTIFHEKTLQTKHLPLLVVC